MSGPLLPLRSERTTPVRGDIGATATSGADLTAEQQAQIASQHAAFDYQLAESAEMVREHEALESLMMEQLKNQDEVMKKWIALI